MDYGTIKSYFKIKEDHGNRAKAICPAHPDKEASLSINYDEKENKTLLYCHAGCETKEILDRVGLKITDLFDKPMDSNTKSKGRNIEKVYQYRDPEGNVLFEKIRFIPKQFSQRRYVKGMTIWGLEKGKYYETYSGSNEYSMKERLGAKTIEVEGVEPVLYNLPELLQAIKDDKEVYIVEGEKDADNLKKWDITATCNFDGASKSSQKVKWKKEYNNCFKGAKVIVLHDNDDSGKAHAESVAASLSGIAEYVKCPELPGLDEKGDFSDWQGEGHTKDELIAMVDSAEHWDPVMQGENIDLIKFNFSDVGNAERLIAAYGKIIRYRPGWKNGWLIWSGKHWQVDYDNKIEVLSRKVLKKLQQQGDNLPKDDDKYLMLKKEIYKFVLKSEGDNRIRAMINQAKSHSNVVIKKMNKDAYLLNYKNGTLNMKIGRLQEHNRKDYITKLIDISYDPEVKCPNWIEFVNKIFMGNTELIEYIQKSIGYSMTGNAALQCFYILHGQGSNGKGTFMKTIQTILGDYSATLKGNSLMEKMGDEGARGDLAKLEDKYFVVVNELEEGKSFDESLVKSLTSGADEVVPVRRMYEEEFDLHPTFKMWMTTNKLPKIKGTDQGIWRRVRKIPFEYDFEKDAEKNENFFEEKLLLEMPGILNWALEGCLKWQREGMKVPDIVKYAIDDYKHDMDPIQRFIDECCIVSETCKSKRNELYDCYCEWCRENKEYTLSTIKFNRKLEEKDFKLIVTKGIRYWKNIGLVTREFEGLTPREDENIKPFC